jgi:hypothetical protein
MFKINKHKPIVSDLAIITQNYLELVADENPILYTGTNQYGNRILGVIVEESEEDFSVRYFHIILNDDSYYAFINREISLRKIVESANIIFVLDYKGDELIDNNLVALDEIPVDYLPLEDSYCPESSFIASLNYGISLKGKRSELHIVDVDEESNIQSTYRDVIKNALQGLGDLDLNPKVYLEPAKAGSFKINYRIEFENEHSSLFHVESNLIANYLKSFFDYIVRKLPKEEKNSLKEENISSKAFKEVEDKLYQVYNNAHYDIKKEAIEQKLIDNINESALKFEEVTIQINNSSSFDKIELINYPKSGGEVGLGIIDKTFYDSIKEQLNISEPAVSTDVYVKDLEAKTYRIRVFNLNIESGNCKAYFYPNQTDESWKIPIYINKGDKEYHHSPLSKSLDEEKVIDIKGYAERKNGEVDSITVDL